MLLFTIGFVYSFVFGLLLSAALLGTTYKRTSGFFQWLVVIVLAILWPIYLVVSGFVNTYKEFSGNV